MCMCGSGRQSKIIFIFSNRYETNSLEVLWNGEGGQVHSSASDGMRGHYMFLLFLGWRVGLE